MSAAGERHVVSHVVSGANPNPIPIPIRHGVAHVVSGTPTPAAHVVNQPSATPMHKKKNSHDISADGAKEASVANGILGDDGLLMFTVDRRREAPQGMVTKAKSDNVLQGIVAKAPGITVGPVTAVPVAPVVMRG